MIRPGLCSVTFRALEVPTVVRLAAEAGLERIEWAGDVHVPPGDLAAARRARELTEQAGLSAASYGSYLRFEGTEEEVRAEGAAVLAAARALGAPRIRVWATRVPSTEASSEQRTEAARRIAEFADRAAEHGIEVGLEFHRGTLTDTVDSTLQLLEDVAHPNLTTYWQPNVGLDAEEALKTLRAVRSYVSTIHVFSWWPRTERLPLSERSELWRGVFAELAESGRDHDVLLEFVPDDAPEVLAREAATLRQLIDEAGTAAR